MPILGAPALLLLALAAPASSPPPSISPAASPSPTSAAAASPSPAEQKSFADGLRLFQAGDARGAEQAWREGYIIARDPAFLVRMGEAEEKAGAPREALNSYQNYLRESPDASDREDIEARVQRLAPPSAASAPGSDEVPGEIGAGAATPGTAPRPGASPAATPARGAQVRDDGEDLRAFVDENPDARSKLNVAAWAGTGVTVILLGVATFYAARASEKSGDVSRLLTNTDPMTGVPREYATVAAQYEGDVRDGQRADRLAKGFAIAAGATALGTAALFIIDAWRAPEANRANGTTRAGVGGTSAAGARVRAGLQPTIATIRDARLPGFGLGWGF